jgi:hypothetical protein
MPADLPVCSRILVEKDSAHGKTARSQDGGERASYLVRAREFANDGIGKQITGAVPVAVDRISQGSNCVFRNALGNCGKSIFLNFSCDRIHTHHTKFTARHAGGGARATFTPGAPTLCYPAMIRPSYGYTSANPHWDCRLVL